MNPETAPGLAGTVEDMLSPDPEDRLRAEYRQAVLRMDETLSILTAWHRHTLPDEPAVSRETLLRKLEALEMYTAALRRQACMEGVTL